MHKLYTVKHCINYSKTLKFSTINVILDITLFGSKQLACNDNILFHVNLHSSEGCVTTLLTSIDHANEHANHIFGLLHDNNISLVILWSLNQNWYRIDNILTFVYLLLLCTHHCIANQINTILELIEFSLFTFSCIDLLYCILREIKGNIIYRTSAKYFIIFSLLRADDITRL